MENTPIMLTEDLKQQIAVAIQKSNFGAEKTNKIREELEKTHFFEWFEKYRQERQKANE
jgi:hypothetical protein